MFPYNKQGRCVRYLFPPALLLSSLSLPLSPSAYSTHYYSAFRIANKIGIPSLTTF